MINAQAEVKTVITSQGKFEAHPESYRPRVFAQVNEDGKVYELLQDGQAVIWPTFPAGFDYWKIQVEKLRDLDVYRA